MMTRRMLAAAAALAVLLLVDLVGPAPAQLFRRAAPPSPAPATTTSPASRPGFAPASRRATGEVRVDFLDVGQGDAILIRSPEGKTALVDAGTSREVVERIRELGVRSIDLAVVSHHHTDHYGGMDDVIDAFRPRFFLASGSSHATSSYVKLLRHVREAGLQMIAPTAKPREVELGSLLITILPQPPEDREEENDNSIGLRIQHGAIGLLLTGDSEDPERAWWMRHCPELLRDCTVLKLAHHGSRNGTDARWLSLVRPELAIASLGAGNSFGHPHAETLSLLSRARVPLLRTDMRGTISLRSNGETVEVERPRFAARSEPRRDPRARTASGSAATSRR